MTLIERLRVMASNPELTQDEITTLCDAIRALGGTP